MRPWERTMMLVCHGNCAIVRGQVEVAGGVDDLQLVHKRGLWRRRVVRALTPWLQDLVDGRARAVFLGDRTRVWAPYDLGVLYDRGRRERGLITTDACIFQRHLGAFPRARGDVPEAMRQLQQAATAALHYAQRSAVLSGFAPPLADALAHLSAASPPACLWAPAGFLSADAQRLAAACAAAGVFGGMGAWNDYAGDITYQEITNNLYNAWQLSQRMIAQSTLPDNLQ